MKFSVIPSPLDEDFDPVSQFYWNVSNGLEPRGSEFNEKQNEVLNINLVRGISQFIKSLEELVDGKPHTIFEELEALSESNDAINDQAIEIFEDMNSNLMACHSYSEESSGALCALLDSLLEYEGVLNTAWEENGYDLSSQMDNFFKIFESSKCPRPALWHLINKMSITNSSWVCGDESTHYLLLAIGNNPVIGEIAYHSLLTQMPDYMRVGNLTSTSTGSGAFKNPSLTIESLERLFGFWRGDEEFIEIYSLPGLFTHNLEFSSRGSIASAATSDSNLGFKVFAGIVARVLDEIKLGRLDWDRLSTSTSIYFRTIAFYWPRTSVAIKSKLLQAGVIELNEEAEEFLSYSFAHPHISVLSLDLARKSLD